MPQDPTIKWRLCIVLAYIMMPMCELGCVHYKQCSLTTLYVTYSQASLSVACFLCQRWGREQLSLQSQKHCDNWQGIARTYCLIWWGRLWSGGSRRGCSGWLKSYIGAACLNPGVSSVGAEAAWTWSSLFASLWRRPLNTMQSKHECFVFIDPKEDYNLVPHIYN